MFHYVYRITNTQKNKHYYGCRTSIKPPKEDLGCKYFSSSSDKQFIKEQKDTPSIFKYKVIKVFKSRNDAITFEIMLHTKFNVSLNESFYNKVKQTTTKFDTSGTSYMTNEQKKIRSDRWKNPDLNPNKNRDMSGSNNIMFGTHRVGELNPFYGKQHTDETKKIISQKNTGRKHTDETKEKWSKQRKGVPKRKTQCESCKKPIDVSNYKRHLVKCQSVIKSIE